MCVPDADGAVAVVTRQQTFRFIAVRRGAVELNIAGGSGLAVEKCVV